MLLVKSTQNDDVLSLNSKPNRSEVLVDVIIIWIVFRNRWRQCSSPCKAESSTTRIGCSPPSPCRGRTASETLPTSRSSFRSSSSCLRCWATQTVIGSACRRTGALSETWNCLLGLTLRRSLFESTEWFVGSFLFSTGVHFHLSVLLCLHSKLIYIRFKVYKVRASFFMNHFKEIVFVYIICCNFYILKEFPILLELRALRFE